MWICIDIYLGSFPATVIMYNRSSFAEVILFNIETKEQIVIYAKDVVNYDVFGLDRDNEILYEINYKDYLLSFCLDYVDSWSRELSTNEDFGINVAFCEFKNGLFGKHPYNTIMRYIIEMYNKNSEVLTIKDDELIICSIASPLTAIYYKYKIINKANFMKVLFMEN